MGLYNLKQSFFDSTSSRLLKVYKENLKYQDEIRKEIQEWLYDYYTGEPKKIIERLQEDIIKVLGREIIDDEEWLFDFVNLTKKMIDRLSVVYVEPAERYIADEYDADKQPLTEYFDEIIPETINSKDKKAHRYAKLFNTSLTQIYFDREDGLSFNIEPSHKYEIKSDYNNPYRLIEVSYDKYFLNEKGEDELYKVVWTKDKHYKQDQDGKQSPVGDNEDMENPFKNGESEGVIPFAVMMLDEGEDFWGVGQADLVNVNEVVNFLLTFLLNDAIVLGSTGTLLAINLELQKKGEEKNSLRKVRTGRRHPIVVESARSTDLHPPSLEYVSTNPLIVEIQNSIDYRIKQIAVLKGLNPNAILSEIKDTSDYQKMMDAAETIEIRRDDLEPCREFEKKRFEIIKAVNNAAYQDGELKKKFGLQLIPWDTELIVDFAEIEIQKTQDELWKDREEREKRNMGSAVDWLMEENPELEIEQAQEIISENRTINSNQKPLTRLEQLTQGKVNE